MERTGKEETPPVLVHPWSDSSSQPRIHVDKWWWRLQFFCKPTALAQLIYERPLDLPGWPGRVVG